MITRVRARIFILCLASIALTGCTDKRYLSEKLFWQAEQYASKILKTEHGQPLEDRDYQGIIAKYRKVPDACPLESFAAKAQFVISDIYLSQGKGEEAQETLRRIIENFSSKSQIASQAQFAIGRIYESQGKWKEALEEHDKIIGLYPLTPLGLRMPIYIMQCYQKIDNKIEADKAYRIAVRHYKALLEEYKETRVTPLVEDYLATAQVKSRLGQLISPQIYVSREKASSKFLYIKR